eukprot:COSAG01_NODE_1799_length_9205_cov_130.191302_3_plen_145_part_00
MRAACYGEALALSLAGAPLCNLRHRHTRSWWERRPRLAYGWHAMERDGQLVRLRFCIRRPASWCVLPAAVYGCGTRYLVRGRDSQCGTREMMRKSWMRCCTVDGGTTLRCQTRSARRYHLRVRSVQTEILTWLRFPYVFENWYA